MLNELMTSHLGYKQYVSQGGDWGSFVTEWIAGLYPQNLLGFHVNMCAPPGLTHDLRVLPYQVTAGGGEVALSHYVTVLLQCLPFSSPKQTS